MDKLYFLSKEFKETKPFYEYYKLSREDQKIIYNQIFEDNPEILEKVEITDVEEFYEDEEVLAIFNWLYEDNPKVKKALLDLKQRNYVKGKPLNAYFEESKELQHQASLLQMTVKEYKNYLFNEAAYDLGISKKELITVKDSYYTFKSDIPKEVKIEAFTKAANKVNIKLKDNLNANTFLEYLFDKKPSQQSSVARNNMLLSLMQQRLMDKETFLERFTPGGFSSTSEAAKIFRQLEFGNYNDNNTIPTSLLQLSNIVKDKSFKDPEPNYDPSDIMTVAIYNLQNQVASKLIGIFANQNVNHAISTLLKTFTLKNPISFLGHNYKDFIHNPEGVDVTGNLAELVAASVDAVKDPTLKYLNLNTLTASAGAMLIRLGFTINEVGLLLNQPVIKEICENSFNNDTSLEVTISQKITDYTDKKVTETKASLVREQDFIRCIVEEANNKKSKDFDSIQYGTLLLFKHILEVSSLVNNYISSTRYTASNSVGSTFGHFYELELKVDNYIKDLKESKLPFIVEISEFNDSDIATINNSPILLSLSEEEYIKKFLYHPFGYEQCMFDANRKLKILLKKYYPYDNVVYSKPRLLLTELSSYNKLSAKTINNIHLDILTYILGNINDGNSVFNRTKLHALSTENREFTNEEYFTVYFPEILLDYLNENPEIKNNNELLSNLYFLYIEDLKNPFIKLSISNIGGLNNILKSSITNAWLELWNSNDSDLRLVARDLFIYNIYTSGFNFDGLSFLHLIPTQIKEQFFILDGLSYKDLLHYIQKGYFSIDSKDFAGLYMLNNPNNYEFWQNISKKYTKDFISKDLKSLPTEIEITVDMYKKMPFLIVNAGKEYTRWKSGIVINHNNVKYYYRIKDLDNIIENGSPVIYERVYPQTNRNSRIRYFSNLEGSLNVEENIIEQELFLGNIQGVESFNIIKTIKDNVDIENLSLLNLLDKISNLSNVEALSIENFINKMKQNPIDLLIYIQMAELAVKNNLVITLDEEGNLLLMC